MPTEPLNYATGPFRADQLHPGDAYELCNGHPIECLPSSGGSGLVIVEAFF